MSLNTTNPWIPQKISPKSALYVIPQDGTYYAESTSATADLTKVADDKWKNIAAIKTLTYKQDTEDDESEFFDANTHLWIKEKNTQITLRTWELELERYTLFYEALFHGAANPLSDETAAKMGAGEGEGLPIFQSNDPNVPVGVKLETWDGGQHKYLTRYFYAYLKADGELAQDGSKILRPKITLELQPSKWSVEKTEQIFTKQTDAE